MRRDQQAKMGGMTRWCSLAFLVLFAVAFVPLVPGRMARAGVVRAAGGSQGSAASGRTWYIRQDGGDRKQCTGLADAAYRGHGSAQPCALNDPQWLFSDGEYGHRTWIVGGGDTILVRGGPYRMGYKGPNANDYQSSCPGNPYTCFMPGLPSGTKDHPTRLLGEHFASCDKKTQLFGGFGLGIVVNLSGSQNVDVECLELTDHSQCTRIGGVPAADTCHSDYPLSDYAGSGIGTDAGTKDVTLKNLDIHGFLSRGIQGALGGDVQVDNVRVAFNGGAGWDFDDGRGTKSTPEAFVHARYLTIEWNGCNEEYPITHAVPAYNCFDQDHGGYGDGVGTPDTPLSFTCDHCTFRYNTQDGLDLLHVGGSTIEVTNSISRGNMGQQWKMGAMQRVVFRNNVTVHNCRRLSAPFPGAPDDYNKHLGLFCRAGGDAIAFAVIDSGTYLFQNNSYVGYGATTYDYACGTAHCSAANVTFQNNLHVGYKDVGGNDETPGVFYAEENLPKNVFASRSHNIYFRMRTCPTGGTDERCTDPHVVNLPPWHGESSLDNVDLHLASGSPAANAGMAVPGLQTDFDNKPRPSGSPSIGAFQ